MRSVKSQLQSKLSSRIAFACDRAVYLVIEACGVVRRVDRDTAKGEASRWGSEALGDNSWAFIRRLRHSGEISWSARSARHVSAESAVLPEVLCTVTRLRVPSSYGSLCLLSWESLTEESL